MKNKKKKNRNKRKIKIWENNKNMYKICRPPSQLGLFALLHTSTIAHASWSPAFCCATLCCWVSTERVIVTRSALCYGRCASENFVRYKRCNSRLDGSDCRVVPCRAVSDENQNSRTAKCYELVIDSPSPPTRKKRVETRYLVGNISASAGLCALWLKMKWMRVWVVENEIFFPRTRTT